MKLGINLKYILVFVLGIHLLILLSLQFTAWPEMLSFPYLFNHGYKLFGDLVHPYPPLLTLTLSLIYKIFGYKILVLQIFTWVMILINDLLIYTIAVKFTKKKLAGMVALVFYILLQPALDGNQLWFDFALTVPLLLGFFSLLNKKYFLTGVFLSLAVLTKQTGIFFLILTVGYLIWQKINIKTFSLAVVLVLGSFLLWLGLTDQLQWFFNWVIYYPSMYWTNFPGYVQMQISNRQLGIIFLTALPVLFIARSFLGHKQYLLLLMFCIAGIVSVYPRFSFFHFQTALVFLAIAVGLAYRSIGKLSLVFLGLMFLVWPLYCSAWLQPTRFFSNQDLELAGKISLQSGLGEKIFFLGISSNVYVLADRLPPKPWFDNYGWYFEIPNVQTQVIARWEMDYPQKVYIASPSEGNWFDTGVYQPELIKNWVYKNYEKSGELADNIQIWQKKK